MRVSDAPPIDEEDGDDSDSSNRFEKKMQELTAIRN